MNTDTILEEIEDREKEIISLKLNYKIVDTEREKEINRLNRQIEDIRRIYNAIQKRNERRCFGGEKLISKP